MVQALRHWRCQVEKQKTAYEKWLGTQIEKWVEDLGGGALGNQPGMVDSGWVDGPGKVMIHRPIQTDATRDRTTVDLL